MIDDALVALLARHARTPAPRYTSYPTANHFHPGVDAGIYGDWLARLDPAAPVSLYVHIPFCAQQCWYCGCNMKLAARYEPIADYVDALLREIDLIASRAPAGMRFSHLHFGGGTPSVLTPEDMERVVGRLRRCFEPTADAEIAIEIDPRTFTARLLSRLAALGFNRASLGVQEFDPAVQSAINRTQPASLIAQTTQALRDAGIAAVNFDLLYGLPHQTVDTLSRTIEACAAMAPDRVALFGYAHVPWFAKNQRMIPQEALPDGEARVRQALAARAGFEAAGYQAIGLDHFALPGDPLACAAREGRLRRNFQGYTTDACATMLGFGATAIGATPDGFVQNIGETGAWNRAVNARALPVERGIGLTDEDRLRARVIEQVMCAGQADLAALARAAGRPADHFDAAIAALDPLAADRLVRIDDRRITLSPAGMFVSRLAAAAFDAHRAPAAPAAHAVAI
jgi:oxygen-independent coproporphyrinogen-3 oxidase